MTVVWAAFVTSCASPNTAFFSKLHRLTREPIEGAGQALDQMRKYGYEIIESKAEGRRGSVGSQGSRRGSMSVNDDHRCGSISPFRATTPEARRESLNRYSPDSSYSSSNGSGGRRGSHLAPPEPRRSSMGTSPLMRRTTPGKSPLASPRNSRSNMDPEMMRLAQETRRLSMEASNARNRGSTTPENGMNGRRQSTTPDSTGRRSSESSSNDQFTGPSPPGRRESKTPPIFSRKTSESLGLNGNSRRGSVDRKSSNESRASLNRKSSNELSESELSDRRMSEAGLRRPSAGDAILNENTAQLMVGMPVWVDGNKHGRIAYIGDVHFAKGEMAGVHLDAPIGKNNGTVGGVMYFQCEPKRGVFSRLHRLTLQPLQQENNGYY